MRRATWALLALAGVGFFGPWLSLPPAALQLNAYELSEWVTFLPAVRWAGVPLNRLSFLAVSAALAWLWAFSVTGAGWRARALAALPLGLCVWAVLPYYPYILTAYAEPEFQGQLGVGLVTALGAGAWLLAARGRAAARLASWLQTGVAGTAAGWALNALMWTVPQAQALAPGWGVGWGAALCVLALLMCAVVPLTQKAASASPGGFLGE